MDRDGNSSKGTEIGPGAGNDIPPWLQAVPDDGDTNNHVASNKMLITAIIGTVAIIALFVSVIMYFYNNSPTGAPIRVAAPTATIKEKPADSGGMKVEHQDKSIFDQSGGVQPRSDVTLGEQPEIPVTEIVDDPVGDAIDALTGSQTTTDDEILPENSIAQALPENAIEPENAVEKETVSVEEKTTADVVAPEAAALYRIQLGAYASEKSAERAWRNVRGKFLSMLREKSAEYEAVEAGDRTLYRLRAGPYADRVAADQACLALRAKEQVCIVVNP